MKIAPSTIWETTQIELFLLEEKHVESHYINWLNDPLVNQFLESRFHSHTLESTRTFVRSCRSSEDTLLFGIRSRPHKNQHIGNIKLGPINRLHGLAEIGILIGHREAWGKGFGTQAILAIKKIATAELGLRKLTAGCYASNIGSERAFVRAGFNVEGRRPRHFLHDGGEEDLVLLGCMLDASAQGASA